MFKLLRKKKNAPTVVEGSTSQEELKYLQDLVGGLSSEDVVVEVGSHRGRSAVAMGKVAKEVGVRVYAVDPHLPFVGVNGREFGPSDLAYMYNVVSEQGVGESVFIVSLESVKAARAWDDGCVSLLFLDGDHSEQGVAADVQAWSSKIRLNGVIAFHDSPLDGVARAIDVLVSTGAWVKTGGVGTIIALTKKDA